MAAERTRAPARVRLPSPVFGSESTSWCFSRAFTSSLSAVFVFFAMIGIMPVEG